MDCNSIIKSSNGITSVSVEARLLKDRKIFIEGEINPELACNVVRKIMVLTSEDKEKCIDCDNCIVFCPDSSVNKQHDIDYDYCKGCGICAYECPSDAIEMVKE